MRMKQTLVLLALIATAGCTTLKVSKVQYDQQTGVATSRPDGILYSLPKPILKVQPLADGTIDVKVEYLPDREHTYVISSDSKLAKHDLTVEVENGLLKKVYWGPDSTGVAKSATEAAAAAEKARQEAANAQTEERETALKSAIGELEKAELKLQLKEEELRFLLEQPQSTERDQKIAQARLEIRLAQVEVRIAKEKVAQAQAELLGRTVDALGGGAFNAAGDKAPGPIFYRIIEQEGTPGPNPTSPTVRLEAVDLQQDDDLKEVTIEGKNQFEFETTTIQKVEGPAEPKFSYQGGFEPTVPLIHSPDFQAAVEVEKLAEARLEALEEIPGVEGEIAKAKAELAAARASLELARQKAFWLTIDSSLPFEGLGHGTNVPPCKLVPEVDGTPECIRTGSTSLVAKLPSFLPKGDYILEVNYLYKKDKGAVQFEPGTARIRFRAAEPPWGRQ